MNKKLSEIITLLNPLQIIHYENCDITGISYLGETTKKGDLFCCINEYLKYSQWIEGKTQLNPAIKNGAVALLVEHPIDEYKLPQLVVTNTIQAMAICAKYFFGNPDEKMSIIGVTGTNGKTTTTHIINHLFNKIGITASCMGTLGIFVNETKVEDSIYTTPLSPNLFNRLYKLASKGVKATAMEISSHALALNRVCSLDVNIAIFTNLTRDHLDFHKTIDHYFAAKSYLFTNIIKSNGVSVINVDDDYGKKLTEICCSSIITYGFSAHADLRIRNVQFFPEKTQMTIVYQGNTFEMTVPLIGQFNVYNVLAAVGACIGYGASLSELQPHINSLPGISGRMENVVLPGNIVGIIDFCHTPDSLENALRTIREITTKRIITVFGCGGDRDQGKRALMGEVASLLSDVCIVTSDNPRTEEPLKIIQDIIVGMKNDAVIIEPDRKKAILKAYTLSKAGDIILVAGKGHECHQIIGTELLPFNDKEELLKLDILNTVTN